MSGDDRKKAQGRDRRRRLAQARSNAEKAVADALKEFAAGDKEALAKALYFYFCLDPRASKSLAKIWRQTYAAAVFRGQYDSWDEVFGELLKKGEWANTRKHDLFNRERVWLFMRELRANRTSLEKGRELAGKKFGISPAKAKIYYDECQQFYGLVPPVRKKRK
jgi:hypothetical protein